MAAGFLFGYPFRYRDGWGSAAIGFPYLKYKQGKCSINGSYKLSK